MINDFNYKIDYEKTIDSIKAITNCHPKKSKIIINKALKKIINEDMARINAYFLVYKLAYISILLGDNIDVDDQYIKLKKIMKETILNNRNTYQHYKELKKILNSKKDYDINDITSLYLDIKDTSYLNLLIFNRNMDLLDLEKKNIQHENISNENIDEYNNSIKKRIRIVQGTK